MIWQTICYDVSRDIVALVATLFASIGCQAELALVSSSTLQTRVHDKLFRLGARS